MSEQAPGCRTEHKSQVCLSKVGQKLLLADTVSTLTFSLSNTTDFNLGGNVPSSMVHSSVTFRVGMAIEV